MVAVPRYKQFTSKHIQTLRRFATAITICETHGDVAGAIRLRSERLMYSKRQSDLCRAREAAHKVTTRIAKLTRRHSRKPVTCSKTKTLKYEYDNINGKPTSVVTTIVITKKFV